MSKILLVDSSFEVNSLRDKENKYEKIITFDFDSHKTLSNLNIHHDFSDMYLSTPELHDIQQKTYHLSKWSKQEEISSLLEYDGINLGNLLYNDFIDYVASFLKKFCEVVKIVQSYPNREFVVSSELFYMINNLSSNVTLLDRQVTTPKPEVVKYSYRVSQRSFSITISKQKYLKLKNITEFILQKTLQLDKPKNNDQCILLVEFDPTKYKRLLFTAKNSSQNALLYNRRWPAIWNLESFNVIRKSGCRIAVFRTLIDNELENKIIKAQNDLYKKLQALWSNDFFNSFFSFNNLSFWNALRYFFEEKLTYKMREAVQEIEIGKKLFKKYAIKSVLILSEIGPNEQIMLHLARKNGISVVLLQHGLPYETQLASERNNLSGFFPNFSNSMIVWGNPTKKYLENSGIPSSKLKPLGNSAYDDLFNRKGIIKEETILLATSPPMKDLVYDNLVETNEKYRKAILEICKTVVALNQKLIIKLHPSLTDFYIESIIKKVNSKITVVKSGSIFPFIENCKVLITFDLSTTILEAQIFQKPVISINLKNYGFGESEIFKTKSCVSIEIQDFEQTLKKILTDNSFKEAIIKNGNGFVNTYLSNRGSSSQNILNFLSTL